MTKNDLKSGQPVQLLASADLEKVFDENPHVIRVEDAKKIADTLSGMQGTLDSISDTLEIISFRTADTTKVFVIPADSIDLATMEANAAAAVAVETIVVNQGDTVELLVSDDLQAVFAKNTDVISTENAVALADELGGTTGTVDAVSDSGEIISFRTSDSSKVVLLPVEAVKAVTPVETV